MPPRRRIRDRARHLEFLAGPNRQGILARNRIACDGISRRRLHRQPLIGLRQPRRHALSAIFAWDSACNLLGIKIQGLLLGQDRLPREVLPSRLVEILQPSLVRREENERVLEEPWCAAPRL